MNIWVKHRIKGDKYEMNMGYSCAFAWCCWATGVGDSFSPPTTKNSPVYGNIHGTRMCVFHVFSFLFFLFFHLCQVFHVFSMVFPWFFPRCSAIFAQDQAKVPHDQAESSTKAEPLSGERERSTIPSATWTCPDPEEGLYP